MRIKLRISTEYLYYYVLVLLLLNNWWGDMQVFRGVYQTMKPLILGGTIAILLSLVTEKKYTFEELLFAALLIAAGAYTAYLTGSKWTLYSMILVAFSKNINIDRAVYIIYRCMSAFILISVSIFVFQYVFSLPSLMCSEDMTKYNMTFIGANEAARYWIFWFALFLYINADKKIHSIKKIFIFFMTIFFYIFTRSDALALIFPMSFLKCVERKKSFRKLIQSFAGYSFLFIWILSLVILKFEHSAFFDFLNSIATGRFSLGIRGFENYGISILGQSGLVFFNWVNSTEHAPYRLVIDNAFYMIMIEYGVFYLILISTLFIRAQKNLNYKSACCLLVYAVFSLAENTILSPTAIFPVIIAANAGWKSREKRNKYIDIIYFKEKQKIIG